MLTNSQFAVVFNPTSTPSTTSSLQSLIGSFITVASILGFTGLVLLITAIVARCVS